MQPRKSRKKVFLSITIILILLAMVGWYRYQPVRGFFEIPDSQPSGSYQYPELTIDPQKPNVFILAENRGTEMVDIMAPFYLFSLTFKTNVFIVAPYKEPVTVFRGFQAMPHLSFTEADSMRLSPQLLVIPYFSAHEKGRTDSMFTRWIKRVYNDNVTVLSVCAGSFAAAATGLFDDKAITSHASDLELNRKLFTRPRWTENVAYTLSGNLYSTAGVSNAVEGSLAVISDMFGDTVARRIMKQIHYPSDSVRVHHSSLPFSGSDRVEVLKRVLIRNHDDIGVMLSDGIDEFNLAVVLDAYHRTFPGSLHTFSVDDGPVHSKFGLKIFPSGRWSDAATLDEMHELDDGTNVSLPQSVRLVCYTSIDKYIFNICLSRIRDEYGAGVERATRRLLDYN